MFEYQGESKQVILSYVTCAVIGGCTCAASCSVSWSPLTLYRSLCCLSFSQPLVHFKSTHTHDQWSILCVILLHSFIINIPICLLLSHMVHCTNLLLVWDSTLMKYECCYIVMCDQTAICLE